MGAPAAGLFVAAHRRRTDLDDAIAVWHSGGYAGLSVLSVAAPRTDLLRLPRATREMVRSGNQPVNRLAYHATPPHRHRDFPQRRDARLRFYGSRCRRLARSDAIRSHYAEPGQVGPQSRDILSLAGEADVTVGAHQVQRIPRQPGALGDPGPGPLAEGE